MSPCRRQTSCHRGTGGIDGMKVITWTGLIRRPSGQERTCPCRRHPEVEVLAPLHQLAASTRLSGHEVECADLVVVAPTAPVAQLFAQLMMGPRRLCWLISPRKCTRSTARQAALRPVLIGWSRHYLDRPWRQSAGSHPELPPHPEVVSRGRIPEHVALSVTRLARETRPGATVGSEVSSARSGRRSPPPASGASSPSSHDRP